jgi:integrase
MPTKSSQPLTKRVADAVQPTTDDFTIWDSGLSGFGLRVRPSGNKSFLIKYRTAEGEQRKVTLGQYGALTVDEARKLARTALGSVAKGQDPAMEKKRARDAQTISELCDFYLEEVQAGRVLYRGKAKRASTLTVDEGRIRRHIKPLIGNRKLEQLTVQDVQKFYHDVSDGKTKADVRTKARGRAMVDGGVGTAKKAVSLLSAMINFAIKRGLVRDNPCRFVERPADGKRDRFLNPAEYTRFGKVLADYANARISYEQVLALRLLALTGCRSGEVVSLKRDAVDFHGRALRLAETKTGPQVRPAGEAALALLRVHLHTHSSEWVFPSVRGGEHIRNLRKPMIEIAAAARLTDVTPHVLRHSFATVAHELGYSELTIAGLLGHRLNSITSRYAHHIDYVLSDAADRVSDLVDRRLNGVDAERRDS